MFVYNLLSLSSDTSQNSVAFMFSYFQCETSSSYGSLNFLVSNCISQSRQLIYPSNFDLYFLLLSMTAITLIFGIGKFSPSTTHLLWVIALQSEQNYFSAHPQSFAPSTHLFKTFSLSWSSKPVGHCSNRFTNLVGVFQKAFLHLQFQSRK